MSGNLVDVCPVGALTSAPYQFAARPWELRKTLSIDVMDAVGSNIRVDARGRHVMRVLPRLHEGVNEEWIADKTRHACDGLARQRLDRPYVRGADGRLKAASWEEAFGAIKARLKGLDGKKVAAIAGDLCDAESMLALKDLMTNLGSPNLDCRQDGAKVGAGARAGYLFNSGIAGIERADALLIVGSNPRWEAPIINARIRKRFLHGGLPIGVIGESVDLTYQTQYLGAGPDTLKELVEGCHPFAETLEKAKRPMLILGSGALARSDGAAILALARQLAVKTGMITEASEEQAAWNGFNVLQRAASRVAGLDLGFLPDEGGLSTEEILGAAESGAVEVVYLLGADELEVSRLAKAFVIYQGHHGDAGAQAADVILPGAAYTEKNGTYVNTEGRVQLGRLAAFPPGEAREDWTILRALSGELGQALPYDNLGMLRQSLVERYPGFGAIDQIEQAAWEDFGTEGEVTSTPFSLPIANYYMTDPISRSSETMARCTEALGKAKLGATGTDG